MTVVLKEGDICYSLGTIQDGILHTGGVVKEVISLWNYMEPLCYE